MQSSANVIEQVCNIISDVFLNRLYGISFKRNILSFRLLVINYDEAHLLSYLASPPLKLQMPTLMYLIEMNEEMKNEKVVNCQLVLSEIGIR